MNNITSIDYQNFDQTTDQDGVMARWSQEFPRISPSYKTKADSLEAPWGTKSIPVNFDLW